MSNNKAREYTSPILEELMSEITPEEMKATEQKMLQELNKQSSIEWLSNQSYELFEQYSEGNFNRTILNKLMVEATEQAKEMHKQEIVEAYRFGLSDEYVIGSQKYYNETFGK